MRNQKTNLNPDPTEDSVIAADQGIGEAVVMGDKVITVPQDIVDKMPANQPESDLDRYLLNRSEQVLRFRPSFKIARAPARPVLSILGMGYVGIVSAACFANSGHTVYGVDPDKKRMKAISKGSSPIVEAGLDELLEKANSLKRIQTNTGARKAVRNSNITLVCVGTPSDKNGGCDLKYLRIVSEQIGAALKQKHEYHLVVYRSTVPPGTTREVIIPILEKHSGKKCGEDFGLCFNPEFLRESTAIDDFYNPPVTVIGAIDERSAKYAARLYEDIDAELVQTSIEAAEFVKYVNNSWHAVKVTFANEVGRLCKAVGVDSHAVMDIFAKDSKLNLSLYYLKPGFAYGGSCLPKDTRGIISLAEKHGVEVPLMNGAIVSNEFHVTHALSLIQRYTAKTIGIVGLSFKAGTDDLRESPILKLITLLHLFGYRVRFYDPNMASPSFKSAISCIDARLVDAGCQTAEELIEISDLVVVAHQHKYAKQIALKALESKPLIDLVRLDDEILDNRKYQGICW